MVAPLQGRSEMRGWDELDVILISRRCVDHHCFRHGGHPGALWKVKGLRVAYRAATQLAG